MERNRETGAIPCGMYVLYVHKATFARDRAEEQTTKPGDSRLATIRKRFNLLLLAKFSPNQVLTHAARAATLWPRAARAKGPGQGKAKLIDFINEYALITSGKDDGD